MEENKEMDIFTMFNRMVSGLYSLLKKVGGIVGKALQLTYKYKALCALFIIVSSSLAIYQTTGDRKVYKGDMTISINDGNSFQYAEMVNSLNKYAKDLDHEGLAAALDLPSEIANEVRFLKPYFLIDMNKDSLCDIVDFKREFRASDTSNVRMHDGLVISVGMSSTEHYEEMEAALIEYFIGNQYLQDLNTARVNNLSELEQSLENDFNLIDSLQKIEYFQKNTNGINIMKNLQVNTDKQMFYFNKVDILEKKMEISTKLTVKQDIVTVTSRFQPTKKSVNRPVTTLCCYCGISYALFLLLALLLKNKSVIMDFLKGKEER